MRILIAVLIALLLGLNILLWRTDDMGVRKIRALQADIAAQKADNEALTERNKTLEAEVASLKQNLEAIEERARSELGMVGRDETFYHLLEEEPTWAIPEPAPPSPRKPKRQ
jgi:cell division protein FtsB